MPVVASGARPSSTGSTAGWRPSDRASSPCENDEETDPPLNGFSDRGRPSSHGVLPVAGRHVRSRIKPKGLLCPAKNDINERWKRPGALQPLSRSLSGHVYGKKMTLGCAQLTSSGQLRSRKAKTGQPRRRGEAVRSMLPWWQNSTPNINDTCVENVSTTEDAGRFSRGQKDALCQHSSACSDGLPTTAAGDGDGDQMQQHPTMKSPDAIPKCHGVDDKENIADQRTVGAAGESALGHSGVRTSCVPGNNDEDGLERGAKPYNHYSNLFENPPPSIPTVDQYIFDDNITYKAITKRGHTEAIPVEMAGDGVLGIGQCGTVPWDATIRGENQDLEFDIDPSALLYADEDIDKVPLCIYSKPCMNDVCLMYRHTFSNGLRHGSVPGMFRRLK